MTSNGFQQSAYNKYSNSNTSPSDIDIGNDIIKTGNLFMSDPKKHEDLKLMLESNKDSSKLEAMKRIITMVAKGRDCADLFPSVVKNVVSKNAEVKKLVYAYLTRYAEEKQDLALLSISTFQRALKDPNQLIRGSALRVLSSIRVPMIVPIMMLAIKESVNDMSPYVRKIAAHAIPKMYSLDASTKEQLIEVIEKLLADKTTLVAGSAIQAFEEVCPERLDLIHKHYCKLCALLIDVEEWGQVVIINMLTRYTRTQFVDPNLVDVVEVNKTFYSDEENSSNSESEHENQTEKTRNKIKTMDPDHRLLLTSVRPLLHSRNSAVVMSVAQLFYHCAPKSEMNIVIMSLIRLLKSNKEVQYVILNNIATMSINQPELFQGNLKSFYVFNSEPTQVKLLKLEILTNLANENNISIILRELQSYVSNTDQEFVTATIQAIGRCASNITDVSDNCLSGLVQLISRKDENIVAEAIVVIRKLLQMQTSDHREIIVNMALLLDTINVPMAKASIIWLIGEYCDRVPKLAPDVLRKAAKNFADEKDIVKLQTINLAAKLFITNSKQCRLLTQYVLNLAKYDMNYDIRDRARFIRALLFPQTQENKEDSQNTSSPSSFLSRRIKKIFLATKPAPLLHSNYKDRHQYQLGTLSHILNHRVTGYSDLPDWPKVAPDASVRFVKESEEFSRDGEINSLLVNQNIKSKKHESEFCEDDSDSSTESSSTSSSGSKDSSLADENKEGSATEDSSESSSENEESDEVEQSVDFKPKIINNEKKANEKKPETTILNKSEMEFENRSKDSSNELTDSESASTSESEGSDTSSDHKPVNNVKQKVITKKIVSDTVQSPAKAPEIDLLLDFDEPVFDINSQPAVNKSVISSKPLIPSIMDKIMTLDSGSNSQKSNFSDFYIPTDVSLKTIELLSKFNSSIMSVDCQFTRSLSVTLNNPKLVSVNLLITNICNDVLHNVKIIRELSSINIDSFSQIDTLLPGKTISMTVAIDFKDCSKPVHLTLGFYILVERNISDGKDLSPRSKEQEKQVELKITAPLGELFQPINMTEKAFLQLQSKLRGLSTYSSSFLATVSMPLVNYIKPISQAVYSVSNITTVSNNSDDASVTLRYAANSSSSQLPCLIEVSLNSSDSLNSGSATCRVKINSEQMTLATQLVKELIDAIKLVLPCAPS